MEKEVLRDRNGFRLGTLEDNGKIITLRDRNGFRLGTYDKKANITRDRNGFRVGTGNLLTTLLK